MQRHYDPRYIKSRPEDATATSTQFELSDLTPDDLKRAADALTKATLAS